jgi:hypothetical protein
MEVQITSFTEVQMSNVLRRILNKRKKKTSKTNIRVNVFSNYLYLIESLPDYVEKEEIYTVIDPDTGEEYYFPKSFRESKYPIKDKPQYLVHQINYYFNICLISKINTRELKVVILRLLKESFNDKNNLKLDVSICRNVKKLYCVIRFKNKDKSFGLNKVYDYENGDTLKYIINKAIDRTLNPRIEIVNDSISFDEDDTDYIHKMQAFNDINEMYNNDNSEWESDYRRRSIDEQGFDDFDEIYGNN